MDKTRCHWFDESNEIISKYHDEEFGILNIDDDYLFEILVLVNFQTGLSWEIMLKKREDFRIAFDGFDVEKIAGYDEKRIEELLENENIIRNKNKINAVVNNAKYLLRYKKTMAASMITLKLLQKEKYSTRGDLLNQNFQEQWSRT